jgi:hypothetical protein
VRGIILGAAGNRVEFATLKLLGFCNIFSQYLKNNNIIETLPLASAVND